MRPCNGPASRLVGAAGRTMLVIVSTMAQAFVTKEQLDLLRARALHLFPGLTSADLAGLDLAWQVADPYVTVVVTFNPRSDKLPAEAIANYIEEQVLIDLRQKVKQPRADEHTSTSSANRLGTGPSRGGRIACGGESRIGTHAIRLAFAACFRLEVVAA